MYWSPCTSPLEVIPDIFKCPLALILHSTVSFYGGDVFPIPTLPLVSTVK